MLRNAKIVLSGESGVGKSSIVSRFYRPNDDPDTHTTIGGALYRHRLTEMDPISRRDNMIDVDVWDTAGQERFRSMGYYYFRNCNYCFLVFDLNDYESFTKVDEWKQICEQACKDKLVTYFLIGNKLDVGQRRVTDTMIKQYCKVKEIDNYFETSAMVGAGIKEVQAALNKHLWANFSTLPTKQLIMPVPVSPNSGVLSGCSC